MSVTLTANYKEVYSNETLDKIDALLEENYALDDMIQFIDQYGEENFDNWYEDYVTAGEDYGYEAVDAFIDEFELDCVSCFGDSYQGEYRTPSDFAEQLCEDLGYNVPDFVIVDWSETWERNLSYDYAFNNGYVFNKNF